MEDRKPQCPACGTEYSFPSGQYTWRCQGCGMKIIRRLTEGEAVAGKGCPHCEGSGILPVISIEPTTIDPNGEPVIRWGIPCFCPPGMLSRSKGNGRWYTDLESLPHYSEYMHRTNGRGFIEMSYSEFIIRKHKEMSDFRKESREVEAAASAAAYLKRTASSTRIRR